MKHQTLYIDHATRRGPTGRLVLTTALHVARWADTALYYLTAGRTDAPLSWRLMTLGCSRS